MLFIFDMGGVMTTSFQMDSVYKKLNIKQEDFFNICRINDDDIWHKFECGFIDAPQFWQTFNDRLARLQRSYFDGILQVGSSLQFSSDSQIQNIREAEHDLFRLYFHPQLNEETASLVTELRKKHRVVCGTNTIQSHWENHLERGDYAYFDQTYASNKIGAVKPDAEFFKLILEAEGCDAKDAFFTDDREENCNAARALGINTVTFTTAQELKKAWEKYL